MALSEQETAFAKRRALIKEIRAKMRRRRPRRQPRPVRPFRRATLSRDRVSQASSGGWKPTATTNDKD